MTSPGDIEREKTNFASLSDAELIAQKHAWLPHSAMHVAAVMILHERQQAKELAAHTELLAEIRKPHWSATPSFYLLVLSVLLAAAALFVALLQRPQEQSPAVAASPPTKTSLPEPVPASKSQPVLSHSKASQLPQPPK